MPRMPGAVWLGEQSPQNPMSRYDIVCVHTIVGYAPAHAAHFSVKADGTIQQSRDTRYQSAANLHGNPRVIAIENEDHGAAFVAWTGSSVPALTDAQVRANAQILRWAHETHGIPLQLCPDSRPGSRGLAYHRQGIDGNFGGYRHPGRVEGGEVWTEHFGKVCPGDNRIDQLPRILELALDEGDDMAEYGERILAAIDRLEEREKARDKAERERAQHRHQAILALLDKTVDDIADTASKAQVKRLRVAVAALAAPDAEPEPSEPS